MCGGWKSGTEMLAYGSGCDWNVLHLSPYNYRMSSTIVLSKDTMFISVLGINLIVTWSPLALLQDLVPG